MMIGYGLCIGSFSHPENGGLTFGDAHLHFIDMQMLLPGRRVQLNECFNFRFIQLKLVFQAGRCIVCIVTNLSLLFDDVKL